MQLTTYSSPWCFQDSVDQVFGSDHWGGEETRSFCHSTTSCCLYNVSPAAVWQSSSWVQAVLLSRQPDNAAT
jgi:hypothetical protein